MASGFESLVDKARRSAPRKISSEQLNKVLNSARRKPLTAKALLAKLVDGGGELGHLNTLTGP